MISVGEILVEIIPQLLQRIWLLEVVFEPDDVVGGEGRC